MKHRTWLLPIFLGGLLSLIHFLPAAGTIAESAVKMELPEESDNWAFKKQQASEAELGTLAADTQFSKAVCLKPRPGEVNIDGYLIPDRVDLSIVLSGADINNSIHRPERCMPAQGHNITSSKSQVIKLANGREIPIKRLISVQSIHNSENNQREEYLKFNCLTYYFFVGHDTLTNDHMARTFIDIKDRLVRGIDQRWAYVSLSMWYGKVPWIEKEVPFEEADSKLRAFITNFGEAQIDWNQVKP